MMNDEINKTDVMTNDEVKNTNTRCGYVAVIGMPNAGKSTLLNKILGQKISIVTSKPQTTRNKILAILNEKDVQVIFLDTPGIHNPHGPLGRYMLKATDIAINDADVITWLINLNARHTDGKLTNEELDILNKLISTKKKTIILLNKVDKLKDKTALIPLMQFLSEQENICDIIPVSALKGLGIDEYKKILINYLPESPFFYPPDTLSSQNERFLVAELIREAVTDLTHQEIPYKSAVTIDRFVQEKTQISIIATLHVEKSSQKMITIGKNGSMIKSIGERSRKEAEKLLDGPVDLRIHVHVSPAWTRNLDGIQKMGYE